MEIEVVQILTKYVLRYWVIKPGNFKGITFPHKKSIRKIRKGYKKLYIGETDLVKFFLIGSTREENRPGAFAGIRDQNNWMTLSAATKEAVVWTAIEMGFPIDVEQIEVLQKTVKNMSKYPDVFWSF